MASPDPFELQRFLDSQEPIYNRVCAELRQGRKQSHWMWFVFPQLRGLGLSPMDNRYGIASREEAQAYAAHSILGARLRDCTALVLAVENRSLAQIFGTPDDLKFHSSMTLFAHTAADNQIFVEALQKYFAGKPDQLTTARM
jgi:uncharacterized protein (DUF1810 family)